MGQISFLPYNQSVNRGSLILGLLYALNLTIWLVILDIGLTTGIIQAKLITPLITYSKQVEKQLSATPVPLPKINNASSSATIKLTPSPSPKTVIKPQTKIIYVTPKPLPTPKPGEPGSKEWDEEFWRKWNEMSAHNDEMQKKVEDSINKTCAEHPTLCQ